MQDRVEDKMEQLLQPEIDYNGANKVQYATPAPANHETHTLEQSIEKMIEICDLLESLESELD
jgi:hypothetical protein